MNCEQARLEIVPYLRRESDADTSAGLQSHLASCSACRSEASELEISLELVEGMGVARPPEDLQTAVRAELERERMSSVLGLAVSASSPMLKKRVMRAVQELDTDQSAERTRWRVRLMRLTAAAALLAAGFLAARAVTGGESLVTPPRLAGVPEGHETQVLSLSGMGPAEASVRHYRHDNFRVTLSVEGFDVTPPGMHYAVWIRGTRGEVAVGTFRLKRPDDFSIPFAVGVNPSEYPDFVVTLEPNDGEARLTGEVVTRGRFDPDEVHHGRYDP